MPKTTILATTALVVAAFGFQLPSVHADHSWGNYHWERVGAAELDLGDNVDGDLGGREDDNWKLLLHEASADWSDPDRVGSSRPDFLQTTVVAGTVANPKNCKADVGRVEVCNASYGYNGWLGMAQISVSGGHITKGIAKLNDTYLSNGGTYDTKVWRGLVMCQEVGHTFGLGHQNEDFGTNTTDSCMEYTSTPTPIDMSPDDHDYEQLETIYASHGDGESSTVVRPGNGKGNNRNGKVVAVTGFEFATYVRDNPDDWGQAVAFTSKGQPHLFVKDLGEGEKLITHVLWTEDARAGAHFPHH